VLSECWWRGKKKQNKNSLALTPTLPGRTGNVDYAQYRVEALSLLTSNYTTARATSSAAPWWLRTRNEGEAITVEWRRRHEISLSMREDMIAIGGEAGHMRVSMTATVVVFG
jgi:hypothetical protein